MFCFYDHCKECCFVISHHHSHPLSSLFLVIPFTFRDYFTTISFILTYIKDSISTHQQITHFPAKLCRKLSTVSLHTLSFKNTGMINRFIFALRSILIYVRSVYDVESAEAFRKQIKSPVNKSLQKRFLFRLSSRREIFEKTINQSN